MTSFANLRLIRLAASAWVALLAPLTAAAPVAASAPAPVTVSVKQGAAVLAPVLLKYEELFGRSAGGAKPFDQIDLDGDGRLSPGELQDAFGSRWQRILSSLDRDADGQVTPGEIRDSGGSGGVQGAVSGEQRVGGRPDKSRSVGESGASGAPGRSGSGNTGNPGQGGNGRGGGGGSESRGNGGGNEAAPGGSRSRN